MKKTTIKAMRDLLATGEVAAGALAALPSGQNLGFWSIAGTHAVATPALVRLWSKLADESETIAAVASTESSIRQKWLGMIAARVQEVGQRRDAATLCGVIDALGPAAGAVDKLLAGARSDPTGLGELETELLGFQAHQAPAVPKLLRCISATAPLIEGGAARPMAPLPRVDPLDQAANWVSGRLIQLPDRDKTSVEGVYVLSGCIAPLRKGESDPSDDARTARMRWILARPWLALLSQVVFTQDAWHAEHLAGGLALELDRTTLETYLRPPCVQVVVTLADGREVLCGSLGKLLLRTLDRLGVMVLSPESGMAGLDGMLAPVIQVLQENAIWRFRERGLRGGRPGYAIDEGFAVDAYRIFGAKYFNRGAENLTAAIRVTAEDWAKDVTAGTRKSEG
jgi:hypothetical protein